MVSRARKSGRGKSLGSRKELLPAWNLKDLYSSESDPAIKRSFNQGKKGALLFRKKYAGKLDRYTRSGKAFVGVLKEYEAIYPSLVKPYTYASLLFAESATVPGRGAFLQKMQSEFVAIQNQLAFFTPELLALDLKKLQKLVKSPALKGYHNYMKQLIASKKHQLPEREKQIFSDLGLSGRSALVRLYNEEFAERQYQIKKGKKVVSLNITEALDLLHSTDRKQREAAHAGFSDGLREDARRLTFVFNTLSLDKQTRDRYHNFSSPEDDRHLDNQIEREAVDALVKTVRQSYRDVERYFHFKRELLGERELYDYDRYAPVMRSSTYIPFSKARKQVGEAFNAFHPEFGRIAQLFFTKRWIDAKDRPGKRGGAFCSFGVPDVHPYVFMNYSGTLRDVFTLAHELGHAIHAYLMREQSYLNFDTPLTIAETASVFAELLLFRHLVAEARTPKAKLGLYLNHIENIIATVHRQISMFLFERDLHSARAKGELQTADINALWRHRQEEMFRGSITITPGYDYWWSYIPHFIHTPFYVYAYSYGQMLALGFLNLYDEKPERFPESYLSFLKAGNSQSPKELLQAFRISMRKPDIWKNGVKSFRQMLREAENLAGSVVS